MVDDLTVQFLQHSYNLRKAIPDNTCLWSEFTKNLPVLERGGGITVVANLEVVNHN